MAADHGDLHCFPVFDELCLYPVIVLTKAPCPFFPVVNAPPDEVDTYEKDT